MSRFTFVCVDISVLPYTQDLPYPTWVKTMARVFNNKLGSSLCQCESVGCVDMNWSLLTWFFNRERECNPIFYLSIAKMEHKIFHRCVHNTTLMHTPRHKRYLIRSRNDLIIMPWNMFGSMLTLSDRILFLTPISMVDEDFAHIDLSTINTMLVTLKRYEPQ